VPTNADVDDFIANVSRAIADPSVVESEMDTSLADLLLDSVRTFMIIARLEATYDVEFSPTDVVEIFRANQLRDVVLLIARLRDEFSVTVDAVDLEPAQR
jgi:acyl carrier protein